MATFTGFFFGTGEKSTMKQKNIISQFSEACTGDKFVREGAGLLGMEVSPNANKSVTDIVDWLLKQEGAENTLNLTGFSRGSVTCIELANRLKKIELALENPKADVTSQNFILYERLKNLNINIFAIDPVAGMSAKGVIDRRVIADNVKNYVAVLQTDEMRRDFKPQDMTRAIIASPHTKVSWLPMYGNHSDNTKIKRDGIESGAKIMWHCLYQFLTQHGTTFKDGKIPQMVTKDPKKANNPYSNMAPFAPESRSKELLKLFNQHHQERAAYMSSGKRVIIFDGIPLARDYRSFNNHLGFYVKNPGFFVNQLERELFKVSYPKTFNYLFEQNLWDPLFPEDSNTNKADVIKELLQLKDEDSALFARLSNHGVGLDGHQQPTLGEPGGVRCMEPCSTVRQIFPEVLPESATNLDPDATKLTALEQNIYRLTFRYEREKSGLGAFSERSQAEKAQALRNEVKDIIENGCDSAKEKYEQILNHVAKHYKSLLESLSASQLPHLLGGLLAQSDRFYQGKAASVTRIILSGFVYITLDLLKQTIDFAFNLGPIGGALSALGTALQDFGRRCNDAIGPVGNNPLKGLASAIAYAFEGIGFAIKNSFGLKPLGNLITAAIRNIRDAAVKAIAPLKVEPLDSREQCNKIKESIADLKPQGDSDKNEPTDPLAPIF